MTLSDTNIIRPVQDPLHHQGPEESLPRRAPAAFPMLETTASLPLTLRARLKRTAYAAMQLLIAIVSFSALAVPISFLPDEPEEYEKRLLYLAENPEAFEIIFVGSSRFWYGVPVRDFDETIRQKGIELKPSFNLGVEESAMHQNFYMIRRMLESGVRPKYLVVETSEFTSAIRGYNLHRFEVWHDWRETIRVLRSTLEEDDLPEHFGLRRHRLRMHIMYLIRRYGPIGRIHKLWLDPQLTDADRAKLEETRGYQALTVERNLEHEWERQYYEVPGLWEQRILKLARDYDGNYKRPTNLRAVSEFIHYVRSKDVRLIFVGSPFSEIGWVEPYLWLAQNGIVSQNCRVEGPPVLLNFNLPELPYVHDLNLRYDGGHTNTRGSELWMKDLAEAWALCFPESPEP
jgi:hypothetical protein